MATTPADQFATAPDGLLASNLAASLLVEELRRLVGQADYARYKPLLLSTINTILVDAARTPEKDRRRVLKALKEFGGGEVKHIAEHARLPVAEVAQVLASLISAKRVYEASGGGLFFLPGDS